MHFALWNWWRDMLLRLGACAINDTGANIMKTVWIYERDISVIERKEICMSRRVRERDKTDQFISDTHGLPQRHLFYLFLNSPPPPAYIMQSDAFCNHVNYLYYVWVNHFIFERTFSFIKRLIHISTVENDTFVPDLISIRKN